MEFCGTEILPEVYFDLRPLTRKGPIVTDDVFAGQTAIVTGAAQGIGLAIARRLGQAGAWVAMLDRQEGPLKASVADLRGTGIECAPTVLDISNEDGVGAFVAETIERRGRIDILVNNAAISPKRDGKRIPALDTTRLELEAVLAVNLIGPFLLSKAVLRHMVDRSYGRVINIASQAGKARPEFAAAPYAASKAGLIGLSRSLAEEVARSGVTVNCVAPGRIRTPLVAVAGDTANEAYARRIPVGRLGTSEEVAAAVAFLASPDASFLTGATIDVNGGYVMS